MTRRDACRLKAGDLIIYGDTHRQQDMLRTSFGLVQHVTPRGGVLVDRLRDDAETHTGVSEWTPYHHIIEKCKR